MSWSQIATFAPDLQEALGDRLAEALRATGDDGDAALEIDIVRHMRFLRLLRTRFRLSGYRTIARLAEAAADFALRAKPTLPPGRCSRERLCNP